MRLLAPVDREKKSCTVELRRQFFLVHWLVWGCGYEFSCPVICTRKEVIVSAVFAAIIVFFFQHDADTSVSVPPWKRAQIPSRHGVILHLSSSFGVSRSFFSVPWTVFTLIGHSVGKIGLPCASKFSRCDAGQMVLTLTRGIPYTSSTEQVSDTRKRHVVVVAADMAVGLRRSPRDCPQCLPPCSLSLLEMHVYP